MYWTILQVRKMYPQEVKGSELFFLALKSLRYTFSVSGCTQCIAFFSAYFLMLWCHLNWPYMLKYDPKYRDIIWKIMGKLHKMFPDFSQIHEILFESWYFICYLFMWFLITFKNHEIFHALIWSLKNSELLRDTYLPIKWTMKYFNIFYQVSLIVCFLILYFLKIVFTMKLPFGRVCGCKIEIDAIRI